MKVLIFVMTILTYTVASTDASLSSSSYEMEMTQNLSE